MTESTVVFTGESDSTAAGHELGTRLREGLSDHSPDAVILFASSQHDYTTLLHALHEKCRPGVLVGCSSAGEFASGDHGEGSVSAVGIRSNVMRFAAGVGRNLRSHRREAAVQIAGSFHGATSRYPHRAALLLTDALAGYTEDFIEELSIATLGNYRFFGGGAGDDARFSRTHVFCGREAFTDAAVALEILSSKPIGVGVSHGWEPAGEPLRVTEAVGTTVISLNAAPAVEVFEEHAEATGQRFDRDDPMPFFLHNALGIETGTGHKLRVPLAVLPDGSISFASEVPTGTTAYIMRTSVQSAADAAIRAVGSALEDMRGTTAEVALFFDCVATRLRMGREFGVEMDALQNALGTVPYVGCNTYGQIARSEGQFSGFHNCTATVALLPD